MVLLHSFGPLLVHGFYKLLPVGDTRCGVALSGQLVAEEGINSPQRLDFLDEVQLNLGSELAFSLQNSQVSKVVFQVPSRHGLRLLCLAVLV